MKVAFYDMKEYDIHSFTPYLNKNNIDYIFFDVKLNKDTALLAKGSDAVCIFVNDTADKDVINALYKSGIRAIFLRCAGYNNVDLKACFGKIHVYRVPAYSPYAVAEHAFALLQTSNRRIHKAYNRVRDYNFSLSGLTGMDLYGKTIGIIGTGKIGQCMIKIALGYGMKVIAYDKFPNQELREIKYVSLDTLYQDSDIISLHCPLTEESEHMMNDDSFNKMKKGVIIINTSRGALIDSEALLENIKSRKVGAACLDVYEEESDIFYEDHSNHIMNNNTLLQLIAMPNVLITSHQGFLTSEALDNIASTTTNNILAYSSNKTQDNELCYHCGKQESCMKKRNSKCF